MQDNFDVVLEIWKCVESARWWQHEFGTDPPTRLTVACIRVRFEADDTVHGVHKQRSGKLGIATSPTSSAVVLEQST